MRREQAEALAAGLMLLAVTVVLPVVILAALLRTFA